MDGLHILALLDYLTKRRHHGLKSLSLDMNSINHCLQLSAPSAIVNTTVAMISKAFHNHVLFFVDCNILVLIASFLLIITVSFAAFFLLFWSSWLHGQGEKMFKDDQEHSLTILQSLSLHHIYISINVLKIIWFTQAVPHWLLTYLMSIQSWLFCRFYTASTMGLWQASLCWNSGKQHIHARYVQPWHDVWPHRPVEHTSPLLWAWDGALWLSLFHLIALINFGHVKVICLCIFWLHWY